MITNIKITGFNPRARGGRDHYGTNTLTQSALFQSTRPWGARHGLILALINGYAVSIHAPVGGATGVLGLEDDTLDVSIHAPVGGATVHASARSQHSAFQSTRPWGARRWSNRRNGYSFLFQSTRPWGARPCRVDARELMICFNPRARGGRDAGQFVSYFINLVSIHAPVGGATL